MYVCVCVCVCVCVTVEPHHKFVTSACRPKVNGYNNIIMVENARLGTNV